MTEGTIGCSRNSWPRSLPVADKLLICTKYFIHIKCSDYERGSQTVTWGRGVVRV